jgi:hypothetical protein
MQRKRRRAGEGVELGVATPVLGAGPEPPGVDSRRRPVEQRLGAHARGQVDAHLGQVDGERVGQGPLDGFGHAVEPSSGDHLAEAHDAVASERLDLVVGDGPQRRFGSHEGHHRTPLGRRSRGWRILVVETSRAGGPPMTVDQRTRRHSDIRDLSASEVLDAFVPDAIAVHGPLAARGVVHRGVPPSGSR